MTVRLSGPPPEATRLDQRLLERRAQRVLRALGHAGSELSLSIVDDVEIQQLNREYRGRPQATDVLSFSLVEGSQREFRGSLLGDVVVSLETAAAQARSAHRGLDEAVAKLVIHGVLHLLGHDHEADDEARVMQREERRLWAMLRS